MTAFARLVPRDGNEFEAEKIFGKLLKSEKCFFDKTQSEISEFFSQINGVFLSTVKI